ncbi:MAG TPA: hypothetical protein VM841_12880 [Actinomycetota bacterium]|nr:hypothetical protein [Actinomycetota bacterium]
MKVRPGALLALLVMLLPAFTAATPQQGVIAPGIQIRSVEDGWTCTGNFLFESRVNASLYLGIADHCLNKSDVGDPVLIGQDGATGRVAYSARRVMQARGEELVANDFGLIEIDKPFRGWATASVLYYGGPTSLAACSSLRDGDRILVYGSSPWHLRLDALQRMEGYAHLLAPPYNFDILMRTPAVWGDSGAPALTADGRAIGVVVALSATNLAVCLDRVFEYARTAGGLDIQLLTAAQRNAGSLPDF